MKASVTTGGTANPTGDIDDASSLEQVSNVVHPPMPSSAAYKDVDEDHGGMNSTVEVPQVNDVISTTSHDNSSFRKEIAGGF